MTKKKTPRAFTSHGLGGGYVAYLTISWYNGDILEGYGKTRRQAIRNVRAILKHRTIKEQGLTDTKRSSCR